jgi:hypothetical protein
MHIVLPPWLPAAHNSARDMLIELSQTRSLTQAVDHIVDDILDYATETDLYLKRRKWCLATIFSGPELAAHVEHHLRNCGLAFSAKTEFIVGEEDEMHTASLWEAWFGIGFGWGSISGEDIDWGDTVYDITFSSEQAMQDYLDSHSGGDSGHYGWYHDSDGWHVVWVGKSIYSM